LPDPTKPEGDFEFFYSLNALALRRDGAPA